ncbi:MAG: TIGR01777 family oxidoreductase [Deltaproteobacteria bacterium]
MEEKMRILITGGTGFVGSGLTQAFTREGHHVTVLTRGGTGEKRSLPMGASYLQGDPKQEGKWQDAVPGHEVVVNLAGSSIFRRWTDDAKKSIRESRISTTRNLVQALSGSKGKTKVLFNTSAVGYYGAGNEEELTEESSPGDDFLAGLAREWESVASEAGAFGERVVLTRFGIVLGKDGGALKQMVPWFRRGLGSPLGSGKQWFSWIHEEDLAGIYLFLFGKEDVSGPVNCTSPNPVRNKELTAALGKALGRPIFLPAVPASVLKFVLGEFGSVLLTGQKVVPKKLQELGFQFLHPDVEEALRDLTS